MAIIVVIVIIVGIGSYSIAENFSETMPGESSEIISEEPKGRNLSVNLEETMSFSTGP